MQFGTAVLTSHLNNLKKYLPKARERERERERDREIER
jgi:hypothetical protein